MTATRIVIAGARSLDHAEAPESRSPRDIHMCLRAEQRCGTIASRTAKAIGEGGIISQDTQSGGQLQLVTGLDENAVHAVPDLLGDPAHVGGDDRSPQHHGLEHCHRGVLRPLGRHDCRPATAEEAIDFLTSPPAEEAHSPWSSGHQRIVQWPGSGHSE